MYNFIRVLIGLSTIVLLLLLNRKRGKGGKKILFTIVIALVVWGGICMYFIPFENAFLTFGTPEEAYRYYGYNEDVKLIIEGRHSDLLVAHGSEISLSLLDSGSIQSPAKRV